jgi:sugar lactone lactonase YvrE
MKTIFRENAWIVMVTMVLGLAAGCATQSRTAKKTYYFFPPPPDEPRLQYLTGFSSEEAFGGGQKRTFMSYVTGEVPPDKGISKPYGVAAHGKKLYICDTDVGAVLVVDLERKLMGVLNTQGEGALSTPLNIAIDSDGSSYIADSGRDQVVVFDKDGNFVSALGKAGETQPRDVVLSADRIYVADLKQHGVHVYDKASRNFLFDIPHANEKTNYVSTLFMPTNLALDSKGRLYVADTSGARVQVYDTDGKYLRTVGSLGDSPGQFARVKGVAVDRDSRLYAVDAMSGVVQIFDDNGRALTWFGDPEAGGPLRSLPAKVLLDYDDVGLFQSYVAPHFKVEYLVVVINQLGAHKVTVYGFGHMK